MFKILVVDDENLIRYSLTMTFRGANISIRTAGTGEEALQAIKEERFDVCFLDLHLPDMGGVEILRALGSVNPDTKVIVMSGDIMDRQTSDMVRKYAVMFLEKPFDLDHAKYIVNLIMTRHDTASRIAQHPYVRRPSTQERRRHERHESSKIVMCSTMAFDGDRDAVNIEAALKDVSDSGMRLITTQPVSPGCLLTLFDGDVINLGVVRWMASTQPQGSYQIGVQFSEH
ncbi:MAG: response regulator [Nitrospirota bacterium]